ncbi:Tc5 transposase DNA-binding domain-containing protein [Mycena sanguinolenta]|nr:Tc5 transposase DNA-binding domain-containing protein [Mycena sanguinolenta]
MEYSPPYPSPWPNISYPVNDYALDGSIGPSRVLTRRQRAALEHAPASRPYDSPMYISRPQTPDFPHEALSLNMVVQPSPTYHPLTPSSSSSPYSTYGFYSASHSRANSITNPRSASPALSTTSALTSVSSAPDVAVNNSAANNGASRAFALPATPDSLASPTRAKQKKHRLFNLDRKQICLYHKENPTARQEDIARIYGVERSTISKILKNKTKWLHVSEDETLRIAKHRPSKFPEIEQDMVKWLLQCRDTNTVLSDSMIRTKAKDIARALGIQEDRFKASSGWIENFKHRHGVRAGVWTGEGKNVRAARAAGVGLTTDGEQDDGEVELQEAPGNGVKLLSPLQRDDSRDIAEENDTDVDLELEINEPEEVRVRRIAATGSGDMIRPSWLRNPVNPPAAPPSVPPPQLQSHPSVPPTRQLPGHSPYSGAPVYYDGPARRADEPMYDSSPMPSTSVAQQQHNQTQSPHDPSYPSTPSVSATAPPALAEAHAALDTVIRFFDTHESGAGLLRTEERSALDVIKCALFQAGAGVPARHEHGPHTGGILSQGQPQYDHAYQRQQEAQ